MSLEFYYHKIKKAHKQHDCEMCGQKIEVGENYSFASGKYEGTIFTTKLHEICKSTLDKTLNAMGEYEYDYDMIADWWREKKCSICKHAYPDCKPDDNCPDDIDCTDCKDHKNGKCMANGIDCDKMDRSCWCTLFEPEEA